MTRHVRIIDYLGYLWHNPDIMGVRKIKKKKDAGYNQNQYAYPLPEKTYLRLAEKLYLPLKFGENSVLLCPTSYGKNHRAIQMWQREEDREKILGSNLNRFKFGFINLLSLKEGAEDIWLGQLSQSLNLDPCKKESTINFENALKEIIDDGQEPTFIINIPKTISDTLLVRFFDLALRLYYLAPARIHFLLFIDMKWNEKDFFKLIQPFHPLFQNTTHLSTYSNSETLHFLKYRCCQWNYYLEDKALKHIAGQVGGVFLFAKAALRIAMKQRYTTESQIKSIFNHPDYIFQIKYLFSRFTSFQQNVLKTIANSEKLESDVEINNLKQMGIIKKDLQGWQIHSNSLRIFLEDEVQTSRKMKKRIENNTVFSTREKRILLKLLNQKGKVVSRDMIAEMIWQEEQDDKYSDWAIDQTLSRIRKKISSSSLFSNFKIVTHKKVGFSLERKK